MKIFADLHHGDLYYSLHLLFEERLGWELYRPIGHEWFTEGYWKIAAPYGNAQDTINQYLDINSRDYHQYENLNGKHYVENDVYHIYDPGHRYYQKGITLEQFKSMKFDVIMPSISAHDRVYESLRDQFQPQAKMIAHLGNGGQTTHLPNVISSTPYSPRQGQEMVYVHQELDPTIYTYTEPNPDTKNVFSMVNCLPYPHLFNQYRDLIPEANFKAYGASSPEGPLDGSRGVGQKMIEANLGWQLKPLGGLGHTAMGWFLSGRAVVCNMSQNRRTGGDAVLLFQPGVTCHDIEAHTPDENAKLIRRMLEPEECAKWGQRAYQRIKEIINHDKEEQSVRQMLSRIL